jgi:hypothetical protein
MGFAEILEERMLADEGLMLRVGAHQRMTETGKGQRGKSALVISALQRRSRKIIEWGRALLRVPTKG